MPKLGDLEIHLALPALLQVGDARPSSVALVFSGEAGADSGQVFGDHELLDDAWVSGRPTLIVAGKNFRVTVKTMCIKTGALVVRHRSLFRALAAPAKNPTRRMRPLQKNPPANSRSRREQPKRA